MSGFFITLEGGEGAGKSTQIPRIKDFLEHTGRKVLCLREPGGTPVAEKIRDILKTPDAMDRLCDKTELLLMYAARAQLVETLIKPKLAEGFDIICDRHDLSTLAYQGGGRGMSNADIAAVRGVALGTFRPDLTFLLDLDPLEGMKRARSRGSLDRFERSEASFFERVRATYLAYAAKHPQEVKVIDAAQTEDLVFSEIRKALEMLYAV
ncbi:MAG: dTMP kinase [Succinivibrio sp.]|nr:dTMP kinase [Succinivibrio sp.]